MTPLRYAEISSSVMHVLDEHPEGLEWSELVPRVERSRPPTVREQRPHERERQYDEDPRSATVPAARAGWLEKGKPRWRLTEKGRGQLERFGDDARALYEASERAS